ncbi:MAG: TIGR01777 family protein [Gloeobacteraceae cyanobacterium ES-bin-144]|nr:TIGR01777 family protein [Verrucomicrobiales bacterium]
MMNPVVVIFGANGFLGRYLCRHFARQGREVVAVARSRDGWSGDGMFLQWDGENPGPWELALEGAEAVINLAGRSVNCRYTEKNRREILDSRVDATQAIGRAIAGCKVPPKVWLNASTATWYRHAEDKPQNDWLGEPGEGFSYEVARTWEETFFGAVVPAATRKVAMRIGMVLANEEATVFDVLGKLTARGLGGPMGDGKQRVSWIHMEDFLRAVEFLVNDAFLSGTLNLTAPEFPTNREWMKIFREAVGMPLGLPATKWMLEIGARFMKTEPELVLKSRWAEPTRLRDAGFKWRWAKAVDAVADLQARRGLQGFFRAAAGRSVGARVWLPAATR